ncbi:tetraacyldisaccharide 4'-kinase [Reichenbachiella sp.]|uniref:tetraacyldisaccharide 4'-kinase n=1 Tax=Reichenbachiella sp. TaxID=2184521 RepID=UPI003BB12471
MMIAKWRYVWWPLAVVNWCRGILRNRLFELGVWKSVEFEIPVVFVGSLVNEPAVSISRYIQRLLKGALHVDRYKISNYQLEKEKQKLTLYHWPLNATHTFCTTHRVLGLSEWFQCNPDTPAFILDGEFAQNEIRPQFRLLISDYNRPFINDAIFPVGNLQEGKTGAKQADAVLIYNSPQNEGRVKLERSLLPYLKKETPVFFISNSFDALNSFNSPEEIEFIADRPNFERLILNILPNANPDSE